MRNILTDVRDKTKSQTKNMGHPLWCTVNGVLTPVVYEETDLDGFSYYKEVFLTNAKKIKARESLRHTTQSNISLTEIVTTTTTKPQGTTTTTTAVKISPVAIFNFDFGIVSVSDRVSQWNSTLGGYILEQSTADLRPQFGLNGNGLPLKSSVFFKRGDSTSFNNFMSLNNSITLSGDFTILCAFENIPVGGLHKYLRILGNSSDSNMFISASETASDGYEFSLSSAANGSVSQSVTGLFKPTNETTLLTVRRKDDELVIRENGVEVAKGTILKDDVTFDQVGTIGATNIPTLNAKVFNLSIYDGAIDSSLEKLEDDLLRIASQATS